MMYNGCSNEDNHKADVIIIMMYWDDEEFKKKETFTMNHPFYGFLKQISHRIIFV